MAEPKVDREFVRQTWEVPSHIADYVDAVSKVGLWDSERLLVSKHFSTEDRILDIGCGAGRTTIGLYGLGYVKVTGVDLSEGMIERAVSLAEQTGYPIPFDVGDAISLRYGDASFGGALFSAQGLMCIPGADNRLQALREVRRVLWPGGHFIFTTHDRPAIPEFATFWEEERVRWGEGTQDSRLLEFGDRIVMDSGTLTFLHIPTRDDVVQMIRESGLALIEDAMRSEVCLDTEAARDFNSDCRMWVVQRQA